MRRSQIPVVEINHHGNEVGIGDNQTSERRTEQAAASSIAREERAIVERVQLQYNRQPQPASVGMDLAQSPGASNVLERTDGIIPVDKGKNVHSPILDISEVSKSPTNQWTPPNTISITPLSINLGSTIPYTKPYFVTEPDSPKSHHTKPNSPSNFAIQTKYPNKSPPYSPTPTSHDTPPSPPLSPKTLSKNQFMDISLASAFTSLNIKRKASEEGEDERGSKLLRLCAPDTGTGLDSQCTKTPSTSSKRKPKGPTKKAAGRGSSGAANSRYSATICDTPLVNSDEYNLCDVPIVVENPSNALQDGRVAGPKQPQPQC